MSSNKDIGLNAPLPIPAEATRMGTVGCLKFLIFDPICIQKCKCIKVNNCRVISMATKQHVKQAKIGLLFLPCITDEGKKFISFNFFCFFMFVCWYVSMSVTFLLPPKYGHRYVNKVTTEETSVVPCSYDPSPYIYINCYF